MNTLRAIGRNLLFFGVVIPLYVTFVTAYICIGLLTLLPAFIAKLFKSYRWTKWFIEPWDGIVRVSQSIGLHLKYIYNQEYLPWKKSRQRRKRKEARKQEREREQERLREASQPKPEPKPAPRVRPDYRSNNIESWYDGESILAIIYLMINSIWLLFSLGNIVWTLIMMISVWGIQRYHTEAPTTIKPPPAPVETYQPRVADKQEADYGPWWNSAEVIDRKSNPTFLNLALLSDTGTTKYSQRVTGNDTTGFSPAVTHERIANVNITETVITFRDDRHHTFRVNIGQPFMFENDSTYVFQFSADGTLLQTKTYGKK